VDELDLGRGYSALDALAPTERDEQLALLGRVLGTTGSVPVIGTAAGVANEILPTPAERPHRQALDPLWRVMNELCDIVSAEARRRAASVEAFDAATVRAMRMAERAAAEAKREFIWFSLVNGWVREGGDPERVPFLRLIGKYADPPGT